MAEDSAAGEDSPITFHVKSSSDGKFTLTLNPSTTILDLKTKLAGSEYADVPADRQRLIYSGRVLKDGDTLASYKVKDGHTIHLVKSAVGSQRQSPAPQSSSATQGRPAQNPTGIPTNIATGPGNNPLAGLTGARYAGFAQLPGAGLFGPDGGMGPPPDSEQMISLLENPQFQSTMNEALQNPQLIDMMIQQNPVLREMGPGVRQMMQSPAFRRMLTDPNAIRQMTQMQRAMGIGPFGVGGGSNAAFPAPGVTNTTPEENRQPQTANTANNAANAPNPFNMFDVPGAQGATGNPFAALFGANPAFGTQPSSPPSADDGSAPREGTADRAPGAAELTSSNPFAILFNPAVFGQPATDPNANPQQTSNPPNLFANLQNNPFLQDPAFLSQLLQAMGGQNPTNTGAANNPFATLFPHLAGREDFGSPPPQDTRPPEERYAEQLRQLNDMGFCEFERNIEALRRTGGSVQGAVEYLLSHL